MMNETITINKYSEYKDSGIEWIGQIPKDWNFIKVKKIISINTKSSIKAGDGKEKGKYPFFTSSQLLTKYLDEYNISGEYIIMGTGGFASIHYYNGEFNTSTDCLSYSVNKLNPKFYYYYILNIIKVIDILGFWGTGLRHLQRNFLLEHKVFFPTLKEQEVIANYLDNKTQKIDKLIKNTQTQINQLKEYEQSLINEIVTKGLNKNIELKDSKVDWIGQIPKHWANKKLKYIGETKNGISIGGDLFGSGFPFVSYGDIYNNYSVPNSVKGLVQSSEKDRELYSVQEGDVFFTRTSETINEVGIASTCLNTINFATFAGFLIRFRPKKNIINKNYAKYYFRNRQLREFFIKKMNLVTRASLSQELLNQLIVLLPPLEEQKEIAKYLNIKTSKIQKLIKNKQKQVELYQELRKTVISDAVTGKVKVC